MGKIIKNNENIGVLLGIIKNASFIYAIFYSIVNP